MRRVAGVIAAGAMVAASLVSVTSAGAAVDGCANPAAVRVATGAELQQALSARVNGKVICITADLTLPARGAASWTDFSLTIDGGGHTLTVDPQGAGLLFDLSGPDAATITLANMEFVGDVMRNGNSIFHVQRTIHCRRPHNNIFHACSASIIFDKPFSCQLHDAILALWPAIIVF